MTSLDYLGFDLGDLAKGAAGIFTGTGNILSSDKKDAKGKDDIKAAIERQKLEDERAAAVKKAQLLTGVGIAAGAVVATAFFLKKR